MIGRILICNQNGCKGTLHYETDEYDSLANGGSYEVYKCNVCDRRSYSSLPD
jgi:hypothetical protein